MADKDHTPASVAACHGERGRVGCIFVSAYYWHPAGIDTENRSRGSATDGFNLSNKRCVFVGLRERSVGEGERSEQRHGDGCKKMRSHRLPLHCLLPGGCFRARVSDLRTELRISTARARRRAARDQRRPAQTARKRTTTLPTSNGAVRGTHHRSHRQCRSCLHGQSRQGSNALITTPPEALAEEVEEA